MPFLHLVHTQGDVMNESSSPSPKGGNDVPNIASFLSVHICQDARITHYRNFKIRRRPIAFGVGSIAVGVVYTEGCPRRSPSA
jgi:hypothetical protein